MADCSNSKHPLQRSGTSQNERLLPGLRHDYVQVDERTDKDWIVFAKTFARYIKYFDKSNTESGNWTPFFSNDIAASLASVSVQDVASYGRSIKELMDFLKTGHRPDTDTQMKSTFTLLFSAIGTFSLALDEHLARLPKDHAFAVLIRNLIAIRLSPALKRLLAYYQSAVSTENDLISALPPNTLQILDKSVLHFSVVYKYGLAKHWWQGAADWEAFLPPKDNSIFGAATTHKIYHAAYHNIFTSVFDTYLTVFTRINQESGKELERTLVNWPDHPPHYALFLSFLKLFREAKSSLNTITGRHLDFYYKEVLRLNPKAAVADFAHIVVSLARHIEQFILPEGTWFRAGKDPAGNERFYRLVQETSFNHAAATVFSAVYKGGSGDNIQTGDGSTLITNQGRLFAAPVINSSNGLGKELKTANGEWHPFANKIFSDGVLSEIAMPQATLGFAIASHQLLLAEGDRKIIIRLEGKNMAALNNMPFDAYLTTKKGWYALTLTGTKEGSGENVKAVFQFSLASDAAAIESYDPAVHFGSYDTTMPLLKMQLQQKDDAAYAYDQLRDVAISQVYIKVSVGVPASGTGGFTQNGLRQLLLSNDFGPVDPAKPFQPFGPFPTKGASLIIGSREAFTKENVQVRLNLQWKDLPSDIKNLVYPELVAGAGGTIPATSLPTASFENLAGVWENKKKEILFPYTGSKPDETSVFTSSFTLISPNAIADRREEYRAFSAAAKTGFIRIRLESDFGFDAYNTALTNYFIAQARDGTGTEPVKPYVPSLLFIGLSYTAETSLSVNDPDPEKFYERSIQFYHINPFGATEQHTLISGEASIALIPQFSHGTGEGKVHHVGECYIGFEKLQAGDGVNVLFQVLEGSADPLVVKPDNHIHWSYLSNDSWVDFKGSEINDGTRNLAQTGIISFAIPADATAGNNILPSGLVWIRASVAEAVDAVSKLIHIQAQAAVVTYDEGNGLQVSGENLPAGTITKLKTPVAEVKKVIQPFPAFGGRPAENTNQYYVRVSERLRHKNRAITIWDYEHLVLEAFPQIHKVKCLSHTLFEKGSDGTIQYNEGKPGYVCLITIPNLASRNDVNPLKPYTSQSLLLEIEAYLQRKISRHAMVRVRNPDFEEVRLSFQLKLAAGFNDFNVYKSRLQDEIMRFLSPWAYDQTSDIQFGGSIYKSTLIDFIEERYYVDYITDVNMFHSLNPGENVEEARAATARSILVSVPAQLHDIGDVNNPLKVNPDA